LPGQREGHVLFTTTADIDALLPASGAYLQADGPLMQQLLSLRESISKVLEPMRAEGKIGASLEAEVQVFADVDAALLAARPGITNELRSLSITWRRDLRQLAAKPATAVKAENAEAWVFAAASTNGKCVRCWHYRADVGSSADDPELCGRCVENVNGQGEVRNYF